MANRLNMLIAQTHQLSSRVIGMQITGGNFIGIALSAIQMSAGFLIIGQGLIKGNFLLYGLIVLIGIALAILIERLSLGGLSTVRIARDRRKRLDDAFYALLQREDREAKPTEQANFDRQLKSFKGDFWTGLIFAIVGMILSASLGDVFWHTLFESLGVLGYILSTACAGVIGLTFIHSELYKALMDGVLKEILSDQQLMRVAVAAEGQVMQLDMMVSAFDAVRADEEARRPAEDKVKKSVTKRLSLFADQVSAASNEVDSYNVHGGTEIIEGSISYLGGPGPYAALPAPRGKYPQHKAELSRLLRTNPNLSQGDIASHFGISKSTANDWVKKYKSGQ